MKKILITMILTALCSAAIFCISACDRTEDHDHAFAEWTTVTEPTCTEPGAKKAACTICGKTTTRPIDALGHDYSGEPVSVIEATCQKEGEKQYECKHGCGEVKTEYLPRGTHDYSGEEVTVPATCTTKGERRVKCIHCDSEKVTILSVLGHKYDEEGAVTKSATCETDGERTFTCERCSQKITEKIQALGHEYGDYVVDKASSLTEDGQKSRHCIHEGCNSVIDIKVLPKGDKVEYAVKVQRSDGRSYPFYSELKVRLYDENGEKTGDLYDFRDGMATFTVLDRPYKVVLEGLRPGYKQKEEPTLHRGAVDIKLEVIGSIVTDENEKGPDRVLKVGDAMYDFTVRDVNTDPSRYKKLSELMKGKRGAYLYFFYVGCGACSSQFPVFVNEYNSFGEAKNDLLVIMINVYGEQNAGQTREDMQNYKFKYPSEFLMTSGNFEGVDLFDWVERPYDGVPFGYFLDAEGVIDKIVLADSGAALREQYHEVLARYLEDKEGTASRNIVVRTAAVFSESADEKRNYRLKRGI